MRLLEAFASSESIIALLAAGDGRFVDVNPAFERITGHRLDQVVGRIPIEIGLWSDLEFRAQLWESLSVERCIVDVVFHIAATGSQWRSLPERYLRVVRRIQVRRGPAELRSGGTRSF